ncbi:hypothetical protein [Bradyrhizobium liaoningense]|nr:hypothetical protein [Bradyrhizobium liaoningense]
MEIRSQEIKKCQEIPDVIKQEMDQHDRLSGAITAGLDRVIEF